MADIFISYSSQDKTIVKKLAELLEAKGWTVWWDRQIPIGQKYDTVIETELQNAGCVLVVWTQRSITSEWVKNEASEASQKGKLIPLVLETVTLPLAFKRIEAAMLIDWKGENDHPELEILYHSIETVLGKKAVQDLPTGIKSISPSPARNTRNLLIAATGLLCTLALIYFYEKEKAFINKGSFFLLLVFFGISVSIFVVGLINSYSFLKNIKTPLSLKITGPVIGLLLILLGALILPQNPAEKNITIRLFDWKKNPITQGDVKIYLPEYVRTQSVDKMGQALFTGIPAGAFNSKMKIEVSSPGYAGKSYDTLLLDSKLLELTLPLTTVVFISGKVKTAAEIPISGVEINAEGTRYYALSITDGSYNLRLEEYTLGDEITLTTSHKNYEDKTISLRINSPSIQNQDIFLNPITH